MPLNPGFLNSTVKRLNLGTLRPPDAASQKFFAAFIGDMANGFWNLAASIPTDYGTLQMDARAAGYNWLLPW